MLLTALCIFYIIDPRLLSLLLPVALFLPPNVRQESIEGLAYRQRLDKELLAISGTNDN
jgi:hypothetical protein